MNDLLLIYMWGCLATSIIILLNFKRGYRTLYDAYETLNYQYGCYGNPHTATTVTIIIICLFSWVLPILIIYRTIKRKLK